jgi:hypothetical protein
MRIRLFLAGATIGTAAAITITQARRWWRTWGVDPEEAAKPLPGDDVVADAIGGETRGITIDAPPEAVWPWLLQMGYGRAGWYSYDQLDQRGRSAGEIVDGWQRLAVGDIVPTHPGGGFEVVHIEPGRALVLRSDTALVTAQAEAAQTAQTAQAAAGGVETATPGVKLSGAMLSSTPQQFAASWAFVLEPLDGGRTRFIERFRVWFGAEQPGSRFVMPLMGFGVFVMMQKQMVGIRERAQRLTRERSKVEAEAGSPAAPSAVPADAADGSATGDRPLIATGEPVGTA